MESILLKSLSFNSFDTQAKLTAEVHKDSLSYWTTYMLNVLDINKFLNLLQRNNTEKDINDLLSTKDFSDFTEYDFDFSELENGQINKCDLEFLLNFQMNKQIRA
jgi:hypothetical protein